MNKWTIMENGSQNDQSIGELQYYSNSAVTVNNNGQLVITATRGGGHTCYYGPCQYTSGRLSTEGLFSQQYGLFEARIKTPAGQGLWPAFWMEGNDTNVVGNPAGGEIDVFESNNQNMEKVTGYLHTASFYRDEALTVNEPINAGFHVYGIEWSATGITWMFDGYPYAHFPAYNGWPFGQPFFMILNLAVGGTFPGNPTTATPFPAQMIVDWIQVYQQVP